MKPAGQWNTLEMTARGKTLTLWVNGAVTCQFGDCGLEKGRVGLEGEGYRIEFRNLKVKELRESSQKPRNWSRTCSAHNKVYNRLDKREDAATMWAKGGREVTPLGQLGERNRTEAGFPAFRMPN